MIEKELTPSGAKAQQRNDDEWRAAPYSKWHRTLGRGVYMTDVDAIEWRYREGRLTAVGVMELTRADQDVQVTETYLNSIIWRYEQRDFQAKTARAVAQALNTNAYIVLFREDCSEFWVYNLTNTKTWVHMYAGQYQTFLNSL